MVIMYSVIEKIFTAGEIQEKICPELAKEGYFIHNITVDMDGYAIEFRKREPNVI